MYGVAPRRRTHWRPAASWTSARRTTSARSSNRVTRAARLSFTAIPSHDLALAGELELVAELHLRLSSGRERHLPTQPAADRRAAVALVVLLGRGLAAGAHVQVVFVGDRRALAQLHL